MEYLIFACNFETFDTFKAVVGSVGVVEMHLYSITYNLHLLEGHALAEESLHAIGLAECLECKTFAYRLFLTWMNLLYSITHGWLRKTLYFFGVICSLAFFVMLVYLGAIEVIDEIELNVSSESLDIPVWLYTIATPLFSALIIVRILQRTVEDIQKQNF